MMQNTKSFIYFKLSLSPLALKLINTLHSEMNMFRNNLQNNKTTQLNAKDIVNGIFQYDNITLFIFPE